MSWRSSCLSVNFFPFIRQSPHLFVCTIVRVNPIENEENPINFMGKGSIKIFIVTPLRDKVRNLYPILLALHR